VTCEKSDDISYWLSRALLHMLSLLVTLISR